MMIACPRWHDYFTRFLLFIHCNCFYSTHQPRWIGDPGPEPPPGDQSSIHAFNAAQFQHLVFLRLPSLTAAVHDLVPVWSPWPDFVSLLSLSIGIFFSSSLGFFPSFSLLHWSLFSQVLPPWIKSKVSFPSCTPNRHIFPGAYSATHITLVCDSQNAGNNALSSRTFPGGRARSCLCLEALSHKETRLGELGQGPDSVEGSSIWSCVTYLCRLGCWCLKEWDFLLWDFPSGVALAVWKGPPKQASS